MTELTQGLYPAAIKESFADERTKPFWEAAVEGRLTTSRCDSCGTCILPPKPYCFECRGQDFTWIDLPGTGVVYSFTVVRHPLHPGLADVVPYVSGIIDLDGTQGAGARLMGNIFECPVDEVRIGDKVEAAFEPLSETYAMMRFRWIGHA
ncbi:MAG TPA: Zn-ribbon domain-containing OB-fold protein [Mycobacteriales bacterium]|jgi:hypothetical protein|nr:Zn-ribbon domain-containing OB-fold protein [Mycobacteriales bacterium]